MPDSMMPPPPPNPDMPAPTGAAPAPGPVTPQVNQAGMKARGAVQVQLAMKLLMQAVPGLDPTSPEGQAVLEAIKKLGKTFGGTPSPGLQQSEVAALGQQGGPAVTPQQRQQMQGQIAGRFGMPMPGAA